MKMDESTLSTLMHGAPDNLTPMTSHINLDKALRDGRRHQWRTRAKVSATVTVLAAAAIATTVLLPGTSPSSTSTPLAGAPATAQGSTSPVEFTLTAVTDVTAAQVLSQAAQGAQAHSTQASEPEANVPLVNGWPQAKYWQTVTQDTSSTCPGATENGTTWLGQDGSMMASNKSTGSDWSSCFGQDGNSVYPVSGTPAGVQLGGKIYTWSQWSALPTDPAKLWPIVQADANLSAPGQVGIDRTYETIGLALAADPISPAMREALFEVMKKVPDVTVTGQYTDSLGRTGTALTLNNADFLDWTVVVDTSNGQLLAQLLGAPPIPKGCVRAGSAGSATANCVVGGTNVEVFVSAGPANTEP